MSYEFHDSPAGEGGRLLVGRIGYAYIYVGSYFPVKFDDENPWRVAINTRNHDWETLSVKDETSARKILLAAWTCKEWEEESLRRSKVWQS